MTQRVTSVIDRLSRRKIRRVVTGYLRSGKRTDVLTVGAQGRYLRARVPKGDKVNDIALLPTIKAAILHAKNGKIEIKKSDYREKVKRRKISSLMCIVLDTSSSMVSHAKMEAIKQVVDEMLLDAYQKRDRISIVTCHGNGAEVLLPFTSSVERGKQLIEKISFGGTTPLAAGLRQGVEMLKSRMRTEAETIPILIVVTDGQPNTPIYTGNEVEEEIEETCDVIKELGIRSVFLHVGKKGREFMEKIAERAGGEYYPVIDIENRKEIDISVIQQEDLILGEIEEVLIDEEAKGLVLSGVDPDIVRKTVEFIKSAAPDIERVKGCNFGCSPSWTDDLCFHCKLRKEYEELPTERERFPVVILPEEAALTDLVGELYVRYIPEESALLKANRGILYINNFAGLSSEMYEALYTVITSGYNEVRNEDYTLRYPCHVTLVGYSQEGKDSLPPKLAAYLRELRGEETDPFESLMKEVIYEKKYDTDPLSFMASIEKRRSLRLQAIAEGINRLAEISIPEELKRGIELVCTDEDLAQRIERGARVIAMMNDRKNVILSDIAGAIVKEGRLAHVEEALSRLDDNVLRKYTAEVVARKLFPAIVNPDEVKGALIEGFSNEAIEEAISYIASLGLEREVIEGCGNRCVPGDPVSYCPECAIKYSEGEPPVTKEPVPAIILPEDATKEDLVGRVYLKYIPEKSILQQANGGILFIKDIDKISDEIAEVISSVLESGELIIPGENGDIIQKCQFVLIGSLAAGGSIHPLLYEHISMIITAEKKDLAVITIQAHAGISQKDVDGRRLKKAREWVKEVKVGDSELDLISRVCSKLGTHGNTAEIKIEAIARGLAALGGRRKVHEDDIIMAVRLGLPVIIAEEEDDEGESVRRTSAEVEA